MQLGLGPLPPEPYPPYGEQHVAATMEKPGDQIGRYKLLEQIGEGGMGVVWMAQQEEPVRRRVALKIIKLGMDTRDVVARFEAERQALALMDHSNIARVFDGGATQTGRPYFVMELVRGVAITTYCEQNRFSIPERLELFVQVCAAVQHAHQKGIVHRDIKPSNVLVTLQDDRPMPKVIDFGVAKAMTQRLTEKTLFTRFRQFVGTPAYMSPEQTSENRDDVDTRSDIYSLGALLYELLTGRTPFETQSLMKASYEAILKVIRENEPPKPSTRLTTLKQEEQRRVASGRKTEPQKLSHLLRGELDWIVMKALEKDRARRYDSVSSLAADIGHHLKNEPVTARPSSKFYRFQKLVRRNKLSFASGAVLAVVLITGFGVSTFLFIRAQDSERTEKQMRAEAERQRALALAETRKTKAALSQSDLLQALRLIDDEKPGDALPYLTQSLVEDPSNAAALMRMTTLLMYRSWMLPVLVLTNNQAIRGPWFSLNGDQILACSSGGRAAAWDARSGAPIQVPMVNSALEVAQFSADGKEIFIQSSDHTARVWDMQTGESLTGFLRFDGIVIQANFGPDWKQMVTLSDDGTGRRHEVRLWNFQASDAPKTIFSTRAGMLAPNYSPAGNWVITAGDDGVARIWSAQTGDLVAQLRHAGAVPEAAFSPDEERVVTASYDGTACVWETRTGRLLTGPLKHRGGVLSAQFSPDGSRVVTGSFDKTARVWDSHTGELLTSAMRHAGQVDTVRFSPDGKHVLTGSFDGSARVWDAQTGLPWSEPLKHGSRVLSAEFSPDGMRIVTGCGDNTVRVWEIQSSPALPTVCPHQDKVTSACFSPDGKRVVTSSLDGTARLRDAQTGFPLADPLQHDAAVLDAQFSADGTRIVTACADGTARIWDVQTGRLLRSLQHTRPVLAAQFSGDGAKILTTAADAMLRIWDLTGKVPMHRLELAEAVRTMQLSPDGRRLATISTDNAVRVWDIESGQLLFPPLNHSRSVLSAKFSPDGMLVVTACGDVAQIWDPRLTQPLLATLKHSDLVASADFSPDGLEIATASMDYTAGLWDAKTGYPLAPPLQHNSGVQSVAFSPDSRWVVTACKDGTARVWDAKSGLPLTPPFVHPHAVFSAQFAPDGKRILTVSQDAYAKVWNLAPGHPSPDWLSRLCEAISGQILNDQGVLELTKLDRSETLRGIRQELNQSTNVDDWVRWGRWFLTDPSKLPASK